MSAERNPASSVAQRAGAGGILRLVRGAESAGRGQEQGREERERAEAGRDEHRRAPRT